MTRWLALLALVLVCARAATASTLAEWVEDADQPDDAAQIVDALLEAPLDLNEASASALAELPGFDEVTAAQIVSWRARNGGIRARRELLREVALSGLQREVVSRLCTVGPPSVAAKTTLVATGSAREQQDDGVTKHNRTRVRYETKSADGLHGFALVRQDDGSALSADDFTAGIEFPLRQVPARVVAGDFQIDHGTGLLTSAAAGAGGWLRQREFGSPRRAGGVAVKPTASRLQRWRGAAVDVNWGERGVAWGGGENLLDAKLLADGRVELLAGNATDDELGASRRARLREQFVFARGYYARGRTEFSAAVVRSRFSPAAVFDADEQESSREVNQIGSLNLRTAYRELEFIAECARSKPGRGAVQGAAVMRTEALSVLAYATNSSPRFRSPHGRSWSGFGEWPRNQTDYGMRVATRRGRQLMQVGVHAESTPLRTASSELRKRAGSIEGSWSSWISGVLESSARVARAWGEDTRLDAAAVATVNDRLRVDVSWMTEPEIKAQLELRRAKAADAGDAKQGTLVSLQARQVHGKWRVGVRVMAFDLESDAVAMSPYEQGLPGEFPLVALAGTGSRAAISAARRFRAGQLAVRAGYQASRLQGRERRGWEAAAALTMNR